VKKKKKAFGKSRRESSGFFSRKRRLLEVRKRGRAPGGELRKTAANQRETVTNPRRKRMMAGPSHFERKKGAIALFLRRVGENPVLIEADGVFS